MPSRKRQEQRSRRAGGAAPRAAPAPRVPPGPGRPGAPAGGGSDVRRAVERRSAPLLRGLQARPRWLLPLGTALLLAGVVLLPPAAALVSLVVLLAVVGWLSYLSWPVVDRRGRAIRLATLALLLVLGAQSVLA